MNVELHPIKTNDYRVSPVNLYGFEAAKAAEREAVINEVLEIINAFEKKPVRCKDSVYIIENDELWNAIKLHLTTEIRKLRGGKE